MNNLTTTEKNWLTQFTTITRRVYEDMLKLRKKDYTDYTPPDVIERRQMNDKLKEHDNLLGGLFRQMTASFGGLMKLDEKLKGKK